MIRLQIEDGVRCRERTAFVYHQIGDFQNSVDPVLRYDALDAQISLFEIRIALFFGQDFGFEGENVFWCHEDLA
jgi:hypothetical protein